MKSPQHKTVSLYFVFKHCSLSELNASHSILNHAVQFLWLLNYCNNMNTDLSHYFGEGIYSTLDVLI